MTGQGSVTKLEALLENYWQKRISCATSKLCFRSSNRMCIARSSKENAPCLSTRGALLLLFAVSAYWLLADYLALTFALALPPRLLLTVMFCGLLGQENFPTYPVAFLLRLPMSALVEVT